ncbi:hypothetical protein [Streptomyces sp. DSM 40750]|uniref:hypothetical protein n=1 Tax=Streptomyces sp. DSM 40750 TaxID=2801030 RepID=UPI00214B8F95|nr:hypothetical protein [Streptomyces sp. DSM 40750]UUU20212.1 hypothetical protein JIX55_07775 [Streptomyces sp. DSM 40750]
MVASVLGTVVAVVAQVPVQGDVREALRGISGAWGASDRVSVVGAAASRDNPTMSVITRRRRVVVSLAVNADPSLGIVTSEPW